MFTVTVERADGREQTIPLTEEVETEEAARREVREFLPDATVLSVDEERSTAPMPDPDLIELRELPEAARGALAEYYREKLESSDVPAAEMKDDELIRTVFSWTDEEHRQTVIRILRSVEDDR